MVSSKAGFLPLDLPLEEHRGTLLGLSKARPRHVVVGFGHDALLWCSPGHVVVGSAKTISTVVDDDRARRPKGSGSIPLNANWEPSEGQGSTHLYILIMIWNSFSLKNEETKLAASHLCKAQKHKEPGGCRVLSW